MAQDYILGNTKYWDEHEVLMDHSYSSRHRITRTGELLDFSVQQNLALVSLVEAV